MVWSFRFYITLYVVREITEEVDASFCFEFFDADNIWLKGGSVIVFVFEPEGNSFILPVALTSILKTHCGLLIPSFHPILIIDLATTTAISVHHKTE